MTRTGDASTAVLTDRQREVLELVAKGLTNGQIADRLGISLDGAKWHVSEIISRLGVGNREEAAQVWRSQGSIRARIGRRAMAIVPAARNPTVALTVTAGVGMIFAAAIIVGLLAVRGEEPRQDPGQGVPAPEDALIILLAGEEVPITCSSSWEWSRPSLAEMEDNLAYVTARLGSFLPPDLFGWYLRDIQYQRITRSASLNAEFWAMSGIQFLPGEEFPPGEGPTQRCPLPTGPPVQAIFLEGLQPVGMRSLGSAVSVEVAEHAGWLHVIYFEAPPYPPGWERLDVVDGAGRLFYEQLREEGAEYEWELSASGALVFASASTTDRPATPPIPMGTRLDVSLRVFASARPLEPTGVGSTAVQGTITVQDAAGKAVSEIPIEIPIEAPNAPWTEVAEVTPSEEAAYLVVESPPGVAINFLIVPDDTPLPPQATR